MKRTIEVTVAADGSVTIETKGFSGADCQRATRELERALGTVKSEEKTAEYYKAPKVKQAVGR